MEVIITTAQEETMDRDIMVRDTMAQTDITTTG